MLLNDVGASSAAKVQFNWQKAGIDGATAKTAVDLVNNASHDAAAGLNVQLKGYGIAVFMIQLNR